MKYARYVMTALLAVSFGVAATPSGGTIATKWETAKQSYISMLSHENPGVKVSAANFIRLYHIEEAKEALADVLVCDNCELVKISAVLALVQIAEDEWESTVRTAMKTEKNEMILEFYKMMLQNNQNSFSISEM